MLSIQCQKGSYFQKLCAANGNIIQLILFVHAFYAFESFLFYSHCNRESILIIIPSAMREPVKVILWGGIICFNSF